MASEFYSRRSRGLRILQQREDQEGSFAFADSFPCPVVDGLDHPGHSNHFSCSEFDNAPTSIDMGLLNRRAA